MTSSIQWNFLDNFENPSSSGYIWNYMSPGFASNAILGKTSMSFTKEAAATPYYLRSLGWGNAAPKKGTFSARFYIPSGLGANTTMNFVLADYNQATMAEVSINFTNLIITVQDSTGSVKYTTPSPILQFDVPYFLELYALPSATAGEIVLKINENQICDLTGLNTDPSSIGSIQYAGFTGPGGNTLNTSTLMYATDIGFIDYSISGNPQFYGDNNVQYLAPVANGATVQFTPNGLTINWQNVANIPPNTSDFNSSTTIGAVDQVKVGNLSALTESVGGIFIVTSAENASGGTHTYSQQYSGSGGSTVGTSSAFTLTNGYLVYGSSPATDPNSGVAWGISDVNGMTIGYSLVS